MKNIFKLIAKLGQFILFVIVCFALSSPIAKGEHGSAKDIDVKINDIAEAYVKLVLQAGQLDPDLVDMYYGPEEFKPAELKPNSDKKLMFKQLIKDTDDLLNKLDGLSQNDFTKAETLRSKFLHGQLIAIKARLLIMSGKAFSFDDESNALYGAVSPSYPKEHYEDIIGELNNLLPGKGDVSQRFNDYRNNFIIPRAKLDAVFKAAIDEYRKRTLKYISLPKNEDITVEYVTDKAWFAYSWYKGNNQSVVQLNTSIPVYIDQAVSLAAHEGYPGHHVYNILAENDNYKKNGRVEFSVFPLFSPQALIIEGSADYGIDVVLPKGEKIKFEREILFPLAGLDPQEVNKYDHIMSLLEELNFAVNEAARNYLNGKWDKERTKKWLIEYSLMTPENAGQKIKFIEKYRSYIINYDVGKNIVKGYVERNGGNEENPQRRWKLFKQVLLTLQTT